LRGFSEVRIAKLRLCNSIEIRHMRDTPTTGIR
jgi:hypothetical protein